MAESSSTPRRPRLAYSLRLVLLAFMLLPPAGWYWWRMPFEEEFVIEEEPQQYTNINLVSMPDGREHLAQSFFVLSPLGVGPPNPGPSSNSYTNARRRQIGYYSREVRTVRRVGWSEKQRHGPTKAYNKGGRLITEEHWRNGLLHGPYKHWDEKGTLRFEGAFENGKREGPWKQWDEKGELTKEYAFTNGKPAGLWIGRQGARRRYESKYVDGILRERRVVRLRSGRFHDTTIQQFDDAGELELLRQLRYGADGAEVEVARTEFRAGERHGKAIQRNLSGATSMVGQWENGKAVGKWTWFDEAGDERTVVEFENGLAARMNGKTVVDGMQFCRPADDDFHGRRVLDALARPVTLGFKETPLSEVLMYLADLSNVRLRFDVRSVGDRAKDFRLTSDLQGVPLSLALTMCLSEKDLTFTYRYETLFVTRIDDAKNWRDRSGLPELSPPPPIAKALDEETVMEFIKTPLSDVMEYFASLHGVKLRASSSPVAEPKAITLSSRGVTLRSALGILCDQYDLTCRIEDDALVVERRSK